MNASTEKTSNAIDLSVVIPLYNERENLVPLEEKLFSALSPLDLDYEIILIDDGSRDGSAYLVRQLQKSNPKIRLIRFGHNHGQTAAFAAGFEAARGDIIVTLDADLQNNPEDIPLLLEQMDKFDVACGWRHKRNDPWVRKVSSKIANAVRNYLSDESIADTGCSLKAFRRRCFDKVKLYKGLHRFFPTIMKMEGFTVTQVKVGHYPRIHGVSKYNISNRLWASLLDLLAIRWMKKRIINYDIIEED
ncbi:MAG: glycosyltransferase family 2 protein [Candidatus Nitrohelix vancouverensis]|uniref:Glycosyltransferase family 2 protein n=1 Tax=Candidatus Nitrohelix vancouverensis TaxID=2705534 RepID=A0A7T0C3J0_9BACT|nr:MAG: glycosyltransferase family 2 protein [Candidatus Nitrohelix vancouverensis]